MWLKLLSAAATLLDMWLKWRSYKSKSEQIELTAKEQKAHAKIMQGISKQERNTIDRLHGISSLRQRAEAINKLKNSDV